MTTILIILISVANINAGEAIQYTESKGYSKLSTEQLQHVVFITITHDKMGTTFTVYCNVFL